MNKQVQQQMLSLDMGQVSLVPIEDRLEPAIWVAKIAVYKAWPPTQSSLLRRVFELRRGLNILWARPNGNVTEASRLGGHGAGKTTFCRLIRFVLGDSAGSRTFRDGFRAKFPDGWVLAEVIVAGERWLVGRSLGVGGYRPFALKNVDLSYNFPLSPIGTGNADYLAAIDRAVFGKMPLRTLSDSQEELVWSLLLPWLARDQEAHFRGLLDWRGDQETDSIGVLSADDRANLVRLTLGLIEQEEQKLLSDFSKKSKDREKKLARKSNLEFSVESQKADLETRLGIKIDQPEDALWDSLVQKEASRLKAEAKQAIDVAKIRHKEESAPVNKRLNELQARLLPITEAIEEVKVIIETEEALLNGKKTTPQNFKPPQNLRPFRGFCSHPTSEAWKVQCPIAHERTPDDEFNAVLKQIAEEVPPEKQALARGKAELKRLQDEAKPLELQIGSINKELTDLVERQDKEIEELGAPTTEAIKIEQLQETFRSGEKNLQNLIEEIETLKREKDAIDKQLKDLTKHHSSLVTDFSKIFDHLVKNMLGNAVTGRVTFHGKSIDPVLEYHGNRESAAFNVVKWLCFDLASLALGMTNAKTYHPRFLIHDSPRESDLAPAIYRNLFLAAQELEGSDKTVLPAFQYIITTTEPPPESLVKEPWLIDPILDASSEEGRLLGVDL